MPEKNILHSILADKKVSQKELIKQVQEATREELVQFGVDLKDSIHGVKVTSSKDAPLFTRMINDYSQLPYPEIDRATGQTHRQFSQIEQEYAKTDSSIEYPELEVASSYLQKHLEVFAYKSKHSPLQDGDPLSWPRSWFTSLSTHERKILTVLLSYYTFDHKNASAVSQLNKVVDILHKS